MDNMENLTYDELIELYKTVDTYIAFLLGELKNYDEQGEEK